MVERLLEHEDLLMELPYLRRIREGPPGRPPGGAARKATRRAARKATRRAARKATRKAARKAVRG